MQRETAHACTCHTRLTTNAAEPALPRRIGIHKTGLLVQLLHVVNQQCCGHGDSPLPAPHDVQALTKCEGPSFSSSRLPDDRVRQSARDRRRRWHRRQWEVAHVTRARCQRCACRRERANAPVVSNRRPNRPDRSSVIKHRVSLGRSKFTAVHNGDRGPRPSGGRKGPARRQGVQGPQRSGTAADISSTA